MRILLLEDEPSIRTALARACERDGHEVRAAESLAEAQALLAGWRPELAISDLKLPDGDGLDLVCTLGVPVVMLSGYATFDDAVRAIRCGAVDFFTKPVAIRDVREAIARARPGPAATGDVHWMDHATALAAVQQAVRRLPGPLARLTAAELIQAAPVGRLVVRGDGEGCRLWLDARVPPDGQADRTAWLTAHGIVVSTAPFGVICAVPDEVERPYDDAAERLWDEALVAGHPVQAEGWRTAGSWLVAAVRQGVGPFAGLDTTLAERLRRSGVEPLVAPGSLAEPGVGPGERAGLFEDGDLGAPIA